MRASGRPGEGQGPEGRGFRHARPGQPGSEECQAFPCGRTAARHPVTGPVNGVAPGQPAASFRLSKGIAERLRRDSMLMPGPGQPGSEECQAFRLVGATLTGPNARHPVKPFGRSMASRQVSLPLRESFAFQRASRNVFGHRDSMRSFRSGIYPSTASESSGWARCGSTMWVKAHTGFKPMPNRVPLFEKLTGLSSCVR